MSSPISSGPVGKNSSHYKSTSNEKKEVKKTVTPGGKTIETPVHRTAESLPKNSDNTTRSPCTQTAVKRISRNDRPALASVLEDYKQKTEEIESLQKEEDRLGRVIQQQTQSIDAREAHVSKLEERIAKRKKVGEQLKADLESTKEKLKAVQQQKVISEALKPFFGANLLGIMPALFTKELLEIKKAPNEAQKKIEELRLSIYNNYIDSDSFSVNPQTQKITLLNSNALIRCIGDKADNIDVACNLSSLEAIADGELPKLARYLEESVSSGKIKSAKIQVILPVSDADIQSLASLKLQKISLALNIESAAKLKAITG